MSAVNTLTPSWSASSCASRLTGTSKARMQANFLRPFSSMTEARMTSRLCTCRAALPCLHHWAHSQQSSICQHRLLGAEPAGMAESSSTAAAAEACTGVQRAGVLCQGVLCSALLALVVHELCKDVSTRTAEGSGCQAIFICPLDRVIPRISAQGGLDLWALDLLCMWNVQCQSHRPNVDAGDFDVDGRRAQEFEQSLQGTQSAGLHADSLPCTAHS